MANTENTKEKKTMRKRARPLRGGSGAVTKEAREKQVRMREPAQWEGPTNKLSSPHFWELQLRLYLSGCRNLKPKQPTVCSSVTRRQVRKHGQVLQVLRRRTPKRGSPTSCTACHPRPPQPSTSSLAMGPFPRIPRAHSRAVSCCPPRAGTHLDAVSPLLGFSPPSAQTTSGK